MNRLVWIITLPIALLVILFALMNRQEVTLSLWPLPWDVGAPLFLFTLLAVLFGFLFGALVAWVSGRTTRQKLRAARRELTESRDEIALLKRSSAQNPSAPVIAGRLASPASSKVLPPAA